MFLVYVRGPSGLQPQRWSELFHDSWGRPYPQVATHKLAAEESFLPLDVLAKKYPPPAEVHAARLVQTG
jgi:hypothetical protein